MRSFSTQILDELASEELRPAYLFSMIISGTTYRYTDCQVPIYFNSQVYDSQELAITNISYSMDTIVDRVNLEIDNLDSAMTALFVGGTPKGSAAQLDRIVLNSDNNVIGNVSVVAFQGEIDKWNLDESILKLTLVSQFVRWQQTTFGPHSASCRWKAFKSTECDYAGASTWCDRTHNRCVALTNSTNFGGYRWLPSLENIDIYWGRLPPGVVAPSQPIWF